MTITLQSPPPALVATQARPKSQPQGAVAGVRGLTINQLIWVNTWNGGTL